MDSVIAHEIHYSGRHILGALVFEVKPHQLADDASNQLLL